jgi:ketosteroid isomerase-like protein
MRKSFVVAIAFSLIVSCPSFTQTHKSMKKAAAAGPDRAYMQQIWDGWSTLDPSHVAQFYASGPHVFFDIAPLKYANWTEYESGVKNVLAGFQSAKLTVNDDAEVHKHGDLVWGTATVKEEAVMKGGKHEMGNFRWTVIWENQNGKWLIIHEHVSEPMP